MSDKECPAEANRREVPEYMTVEYVNSPDREILTEAGCQYLLQIKGPALSNLISKGLPHVMTDNKYRFVRQEVIRWMAEYSRTTGTRIATRRIPKPLGMVR